MSSGLGEELLEVFEEIGRTAKKVGDLGVYVLDGLRFSLVSLQNLQEVLIDIRVGRKPILVMVSAELCDSVVNTFTFILFT